MREFKFFSLCLVVIFLTAMELAIAGPPNVKGGPLKKADELKNNPAKVLNSKRPDAPWILDWYGPDGGYMDSGGFAKTKGKDLIKEGSGGKLTEVELSTMAGLLKTKSVMLDGWGKHLMKGAKPPAKGDWRVVSLGKGPADAGGRNMSSRYGMPCQNNFDTYQIIVVNAPSKMKAVMSPAQDDHAQIWINGAKWFNDDRWTGHPTEVDFDVEVTLEKGANVLSYRCGEGGGHDYANLHFDDATMGKVQIYPKKGQSKGVFLEQIGNLGTAVSPRDRASSIWGDIKSAK